MSRRRLALITFALMMGLFLASLEGTVVSTAMPTIISQLGGLDVYSWVFSIYMLTSTTTIPVFGGLADLYGRKPIYIGGIFVFLAGSALSGQAQDMTQLIAFRALQGLGAGALMPVTFTIIGDIFSLEQRARMQGLFSGVWGVSSIVGPLMGGFLVDNVSWRWVFYLNVPFGIVAVILIGLLLREPLEGRGRGRVDVSGALLLTVSVLALLFGLLQGGTRGWTDAVVLGLFALVPLALFGFVLVEGRVSRPLIPLDLFRDRLFAVASAQGLLAGFALFGVVSYIPLFMQGVLRTSATLAGAALTPMMLSWVAGSIIGGRLLLTTAPRRIILAGMTSFVAGALMLTQLGENSTPPWAMVTLGLMGWGMGMSVVTFMVAVQNRVPRVRLGAATSGLQFSRQIGGTVGVSLLGAVMTARLTEGLRTIPGGEAIDPQSLLDTSELAIAPEIADAFQRVLADALHPAFLIAAGVTVLAFLVALRTPPGRTQDLVRHDEPAPAEAPERVPGIGAARPTVDGKTAR